MVRSDLASSGVLFTIDTESGFPDVVFITSSWGLGECVVQGSVNPDEFYVHKPGLRSGKAPIVRRRLGSKLQRMVYAEAGSASALTSTLDTPAEMRNRYSLTDAEVLDLARTALVIEKHYGRRWTSSGARTARTAASTSCRHGPRP
jgi:pyruvate,water dikinase